MRIKAIQKAVLVSILFLASSASQVLAQEKTKLRVGVTLHPYYSWAVNVGGGKLEIIPVLPQNFDPHTYQPRQQDMVRIRSLDALIVNGSGHDSFVEPMLKAIGKKSPKIISPGYNTPPLPQWKHDHHHKKGKKHSHAEVNSHDFLSITNAVQQSYELANQFAELDPENADTYRYAAQVYAKRLRKLLGVSLSKLDGIKIKTVATVHDGYSYMFEELGLSVGAVVQPTHGVDPSPKEILQIVDHLKEKNIKVLFSEQDYSNNVLDKIIALANVSVFTLTHSSKGPYSAEKFETDMSINHAEILQALRLKAASEQLISSTNEEVR